MGFTPETMTPADLKHVQAVILDTLSVIDDVCRRHRLRYYLLAGTMLGAVRHSGFIPWDDDADVGMPRPDYDRLVANASRWLPAGYELAEGRYDGRYPYSFARIQDARTTYVLRRAFGFVGGIPVDVFPLDGMTGPGIARRMHYMRYGMLVKKLYYALTDPYKHGRGLRSAFISAMHRVCDPSRLHFSIDRLQQQWGYDDAAFVADHDNKPSRGILPKEVYGDGADILFEGRTLRGVSDPHAYLSYCYGDYMTPPSTRPPLNFRFIDTELPYREYIRTGLG